MEVECDGSTETELETGSDGSEKSTTGTHLALPLEIVWSIAERVRWDPLTYSAASLTCRGWATIFVTTTTNPVRNMNEGEIVRRNRDAVVRAASSADPLPLLGWLWRNGCAVHDDQAQGGLDPWRFTRAGPRIGEHYAPEEIVADPRCVWCWGVPVVAMRRGDMATLDAATSQDFFPCDCGTKVHVAELWEAASEGGSVSALERVAKMGYIAPVSNLQRAAANGNARAVAWMIDSDHFSAYGVGQHVASTVCAYAAGSGCTETMSALWERGFIDGWKAESCWRKAALSGSVPALEWMWKRCRRAIPPGLCAEAAESGNVDALRWVAEKGATWTQLPCQRHLAEEAALMSAIQSGSAAVLDWCSDGGHLPEERALVVRFVCKRASTRALPEELVRWIEGRTGAAKEGYDVPPAELSQICEGAIFRDDLATLRWGVSAGYVCTASTFSLAAGWGRIEILRWLKRGGKDGGCPVDPRDAALCASRGGRVATMEWLRDHVGCTYGRAECATAAASNGFVRALAWLRDVGCPMGDDVLAEATKCNPGRRTIEWLKANSGYVAGQ